MKAILFSLFMTIVLASFAQKKVKLEELKSCIGDTVIVQGEIYDIEYLKSSKRKLTFIYVGGAKPNQLLTIVFTSKVRKQLPYVPTKEKDKGGIARIVGTIELYKDNPLIVVRDSKQLEILAVVTETVTF